MKLTECRFSLRKTIAFPTGEFTKKGKAKTKSKRAEAESEGSITKTRDIEFYRKDAFKKLEEEETKVRKRGLGE